MISTLSQLIVISTLYSVVQVWPDQSEDKNYREYPICTQQLMIYVGKKGKNSFILINLA